MITTFLLGFITVNCHAFQLGPYILQLSYRGEKNHADKNLKIPLGTAAQHSLLSNFSSATFSAKTMCHSAD